MSRGSAGEYQADEQAGLKIKMEIFCPFGFLGTLGWENSSEVLVSGVSTF